MKRYDRVKYNGILLSSFCEIEEIRLPVLPSRNISTLDIPSRDGVIFNGKKYESYTIEIDILIDCDTKDELQENLKALRDCFDVNEPKRFYINDDKFILAITEGSIDKEAVAFHSYTSTITLLCCEPYFYSTQLKLASMKNNKIIVSNEGDRAVAPFISVAFTQPTAFVQLKLVKTGQKILVGKYPSLQKQTTSKTVTVLKDTCETTANWTQSSASIDSDRTVGGTLALTSDGEGVMIGSLPSGSTTWKGSCYRQNLKHSCDEFKVRIKMKHNSTGTNGDPTHFTADKETSTETVVSGSKTTYWKVLVSDLNYRTGASISYKSKGELPKGLKITSGKIVKDAKGANKEWLKFTYNGSTVYACTGIQTSREEKVYIEKRVDDNRKTVSSTTTIENMMAYNTTGKGIGTGLYASPKKDAKLLCVIPTGDIVRVISSKEYRHDYKNSEGKSKYMTFYKLAKKYNGYDGYVNTSNLLKANNTTITYKDLDEFNGADEKMGVVELYGFDVNGSQLFKLSLYDDNQYYEHTRPEARIGNKVVLNTNNTPEAKANNTSSTSGSDTTVTLGYRPSGKYGDWNEFFGEWILTKQKVGNKYQWQVEVNKIKNGTVIKTQRTKTLTSSDFPTEALSYVVIYMGTTDTLDKSSSMSITYVEVKEINAQSNTDGKNISYFDDGDILDIDCQNHRCYLNTEPCDELVDIGSRYFELPIGESKINVYSNDSDIDAELVYIEKWIGED